jgi:hypothetical protein
LLYNQNCYRYPYNTKYGTDKDNGDVNGNKVKGIMTHVNNTTIFYLEMLVGKKILKKVKSINQSDIVI